MAAIELGVPYFFYNNAQTDYFALNAPADAKFVGYVTDITGLDDTGVRENAQAVVAGDGGYHGPFWQDRRPWTMSGIIMPTMPVLARDVSQERMQNILGQTLKINGTLLWTPADGIQRYLPFRKQQPVRITRGQSNVERTFQIAAVSSEYRVFSAAVHTAIAQTATYQCSVPNAGNTDAAVDLSINGPVTGPITITNSTTGKTLRYTGSIGGSSLLRIINVEQVYPTVTLDGVDAYGSMDPLNTDWSFASAPGANTMTFTTTGANPATTKMTVVWRDAWL